MRLIEARDAEEQTQLTALREAARVGFADIEAGRCRSFDDPESLRRHLDKAADAAIRKGAKRAQAR